MAATLATRLHAHFAPLHDQPTPDADLLARFALHGDAGAFAALVKRHGGMVSAVCRKRLGHAQDAEDAAQAVFLALARKADRVHGTAPVAAWLYGAAVKACREVARRNRRKPWVPLTADVPGDRPLSADHEAVAAVLDEVANLSDAHRAAVVLCELEGCPRGLAARRLGIAEGTLSSRLAAARRRLAERLARRGFAPTALAALAGLAVGRPSFAFDLPSVTPIVQRITEAIVTTSIAWKLKLCAALSAATATVGLALAGGEEPKPVASPTPAVAKAAGPKFVFATFSRPIQGSPPHSGPASAAVWTLAADGTRGPSRLIDMSPAIRVVKRQAAREFGDLVAAVEECSVGPAGSYLVKVTYGDIVEEGGAKWPSLAYTDDGRPLLCWDWAGWRGQRQQLYLVTPGGRATAVTEPAFGSPRVCWASGGQWLYLTLIESSRAYRINPPAIFPEMTVITTRIDVATGAKRQLALSPRMRPLAAGSDGKTLLVTIDALPDVRPGIDVLAIVTLSSDPDEPPKVLPIGKLIGQDGYRPGAAFSPDGKRAIVASTEWVRYPDEAKQPGVGYPANCSVRRFQLVDVAAGTLTTLATQPVAEPDFGSGDVYWSPDGKRIAFADAEWWEFGGKGVEAVRPHVVTCDADGKNPRKVPIPSPEGGFDPNVWASSPQLIGWR